KAIAQAVGRHPLLMARVTNSQQGPCWVLNPRQEIAIDWQSNDAPYLPPRGGWLDLQRENGLRAWVREDPARTSVTFQFHHACCDGEGARAFISDFCLAYARLTTSGTPPEWPRIEYDRLRERAKFAAPVADGKTIATTTWR